VCVFPISDLSTAEAAHVAGLEGNGADRSRMLRSAVNQEFRTAGYDVIAETQWRSGDGAGLSDRDLLDPFRAATVGRAAGAVLAVNGSFTVQGDRILVTVSCYDAFTGKLKASFTRTWLYNLGVVSLLHAQVRDLIVRLRTAPPEVADATPAPVIPPATPGRSPARPSTPSTPRPPLRIKFEVEAGWTAGQLIGAGLGLRVYPVADWIFVCLSFYPYGQAPLSSTGSWLFHLDSEVSVGSYFFFDSASLVRLGASTGIGLILSEVAAGGTNLPAYMDVYLNIASLWGEVSFRRLSFFLRPELKLALGVANPNARSRRWRLGPSFRERSSPRVARQGLDVRNVMQYSSPSAIVFTETSQTPEGRKSTGAAATEC